MPKVDGPQTAAEALAIANYRNILPELRRYGVGLLAQYGWGEGTKHRSAYAEVDAIINETIAELLEGKRAWVPGAGKSEKSLVAVICMTMRSVATNRRTSDAVRKPDKTKEGARQIERAPDRSAS